MLMLFTARLVTLRLAVVAPAGTVTVAGVTMPVVVAASRTRAPAAGAEPVSVTFAVAV